MLTTLQLPSGTPPPPLHIVSKPQIQFTALIKMIQAFIAQLAEQQQQRQQWSEIQEEPTYFI